MVTSQGERSNKKREELRKEIGSRVSHKYFQQNLHVLFTCISSNCLFKCISLFNTVIFSVKQARSSLPSMRIESSLTSSKHVQSISMIMTQTLFNLSSQHNLNQSWRGVHVAYMFYHGKSCSFWEKFINTTNFIQTEKVLKKDNAQLHIPRPFHNSTSLSRAFLRHSTCHHPSHHRLASEHAENTRQHQETRWRFEERNKGRWD